MTEEACDFSWLPSPRVKRLSPDDVDAIHDHLMRCIFCGGLIDPSDGTHVESVAP